LKLQVCDVREAPPWVSSARRVGLSCDAELGERVVADRLQQAEPRYAPIREIGESGRDVAEFDLPVRHDAHGRFEAETAGEYADAAQHRLLPLVERLVTPVQRGTQARMPAGVVAPASDQQPKAVGHAPRKLRHGQGFG
jgi:hypothetical protein